jgi:hypothetical protein
VDAALDLALVLRDPAALPPAWVRDLGEESADPLLRMRVPLVSAFLRSDWAGVESAAAALNREYPTRYSFYWYRGLALHHLGRDAAAAQALSTYVQHAKDELDYPLAMALLKTIDGTQPRQTASLRKR